MKPKYVIVFNVGTKKRVRCTGYLLYDDTRYPICYWDKDYNGGSWLESRAVPYFNDRSDNIYKGKLTKLVKMIYNIPDYEK